LISLDTVHLDVKLMLHIVDDDFFIDFFHVQSFLLFVEFNSNLQQKVGKVNLSLPTLLLLQQLCFFLHSPVPAAGRAVASDDAVTWDHWIVVRIQDIANSAIRPGLTGFLSDLLVGQSPPFRDLFDDRKDFFFE
jgi:hypothetical protein